MEFSDCHGENVKLADDKKSAKWKIKYSGGLIFSEYDFQRNDVMNIKLNESGHVDVGYCYVDPDVAVDFRKVIKEMEIIKEIRLHKLSTKFELRRPEWDQIIFTINDERHENSLPSNKRVWILIYIKFGNLTVTIDGGSERCQRFHSTYGTNISLKSERRSASLINPKPATVCCLSRKICQGETVELKVNALQVNNKAPSRYHLVLGYSTLDPGELQDRDPGSFRLEDPTSCRRMYRVADNRGSREWKVVRLFDKSDCEGYLNITFSADCKLIYHHSVHGTDEVDLETSYENDGVLLVFELWRTKIQIKSCSCSSPKHTCLTPQSATGSSYLYVGPSQSTDLPSLSGPPLDVQSLTMSSNSSKPLDEVDAYRSWDHQLLVSSPNDPKKEIIRTSAKGTNYIDRRRDLAQKLRDTSNKEDVEDTLGEIDDTPHSHCSEECTKTRLSESVQHHFKDVLDNLSLIELCDLLFQGQYLTRNEVEEYSERHVSDPINARRDFLIKILSKRPICMELLRCACVESKQKHIFEKLSSKNQ